MFFYLQYLIINAHIFFSSSSLIFFHKHTRCISADMTLSKYHTSVKDTVHKHKKPFTTEHAINIMITTMLALISHTYSLTHSHTHSHIHVGNTANMTATWLHLLKGEGETVCSSLVSSAHMCVSIKLPQDAAGCVGQCKSWKPPWSRAAALSGSLGSSLEVCRALVWDLFSLSFF